MPEETGSISLVVHIQLLVDFTFDLGFDLAFKLTLRLKFTLSTFHFPLSTPSTFASVDTIYFFLLSPNFIITIKFH